MADDEESPPDVKVPTEARPLSLGYAAPQSDPDRSFNSVKVVGPFALGTWLAFATVLPFWGSDALCVCFAVSWGLSAILLIAIKVRACFVALDPSSRPWWVHIIAGCLNNGVFFLIIFETTARRSYSPALGDGGTILLAILLVVISAAIFATLLTPRLKTSKLL